MEGYQCCLRRTVAFDFDGVIHSYKSGWRGIDAVPDPPVAGIKQVIDELRELGFEVIIYSTRCSQEAGKSAIKKYLSEHDITVDGLCSDKPPAICYVDDRAVCFDGETDGLVDQICTFRSWTEMA